MPFKLDIRLNLDKKLKMTDVCMKNTRFSRFPEEEISTQDKLEADLVKELTMRGYRIPKRNEEPDFVISFSLKNDSGIVSLPSSIITTSKYAPQESITSHVYSSGTTNSGNPFSANSTINTTIPSHKVARTTILPKYSSTINYSTFYITASQLNGEGTFWSGSAFGSGQNVYRHFFYLMRQITSKIPISKSTKLQKEQSVVNDIFNDMVKVPSGRFTMGESEVGRNYPKHRVDIASFKISAHPINQQQWKALMKTNPSYSNGDTYPVTGVTWDEAQAFIRKLNVISGYAFGLPSEAEWEYVAKRSKRQKINKLKDGIEWVEDCYQYGYPNASQNGVANLTGDCRRRVQRNYKRVTDRDWNFHDERGINSAGFSVKLKN